MNEAGAWLIRLLRIPERNVATTLRPQRIRIALAGLLSAPVMLGSGIANLFLYGAVTTATIACTSGLLAILAVVLLYRRDDARVPGNVYTLAFVVSTFGHVAFNGGLATPAASLIVLSMPAAVFTAGASSARLWAVPMVLALGVLAGLDRSGVLPPFELPAGQVVYDRLLVLGAGVLISAAVICVFEHQASIAIARLSEERARYRHEAMHDPLTGLPNRLHFYERAGEMLGQARERGEPMSLFYLDVDSFKRVNDSLGHAAGDALLVAAARTLADRARPGDFLARLAGDEFAMVAGGLEDPAAFATRLGRVVSAPLDDHGHRTEVTLSVGHASLPADGEDLDALMRAADAAMYRAKSARRSAARRHPGLEELDLAGLE
ncbi:MAG: GGDEF domain-containing protein [Burkholderiaceae bacterium]